MKKLFFVALTAILLPSCVIYQRTTEYTSENPAYNKTDGYGKLYPQFLSVPVSTTQNLDFELSRVGIESDIATIFMVIPFAFITDYKDMREFNIRLLNPEQFDQNFLTQLQFSLRLEDKTYKGKQISKSGETNNVYTFSLDTDIYGQPAVLIIKDNKQKIIVPLQGKRFWHCKKL